jgi:hypothetical protein
MDRAAIGHGMDPDCGTITIPALMTEEFGLKDHVKIDYNVPFWEWPEGKSPTFAMRHSDGYRCSPQESWVCNIQSTSRIIADYIVNR